MDQFDNFVAPNRKIKLFVRAEIIFLSRTVHFKSDFIIDVHLLLFEVFFNCLHKLRILTSSG